MKKPKCIYNIVLILLLSFVLKNISFAEEIIGGNHNGFIYAALSDNGEQFFITDYVGEKKNITVPTSIEGTKVEKITGYGKIEK